MQPDEDSKIDFKVLTNKSTRLCECGIEPPGSISHGVS